MSFKFTILDEFVLKLSYADRFYPCALRESRDMFVRLVDLINKAVRLSRELEEELNDNILLCTTEFQVSNIKLKYYNKLIEGFTTFEGRYNATLRSAERTEIHINGKDEVLQEFKDVVSAQYLNGVARSMANLRNCIQGMNPKQDTTANPEPEKLNFSPPVLIEMKPAASVRSNAPKAKEPTHLQLALAYYYMISAAEEQSFDLRLDGTVSAYKKLVAEHKPNAGATAWKKFQQTYTDVQKAKSEGRRTMCNGNAKNYAAICALLKNKPKALAKAKELQ